MKKFVRFLVVFIMAIFALGLTACGNVNEGGGDTNGGGTNGGNSIEKVYYTLTISVIGKGTVTGSPAGKYEKGSLITLTANPDKNSSPAYKFNEFAQSDGVSLSSSPIFNFTINKNISIVCEFEPDYKEAKAESSLINMIQVEKINDGVMIKHVVDTNPTFLGGIKHWRHYVDYKIKKGVIFESIWFQDLDFGLETEAITTQSITKSIERTLTAGFKIGIDALNLSAQYTETATINIIKSYAEGIKVQLQGSLKDYNPQYKYRIVIVGDYKINRIDYEYIGPLNIGSEKKTYHYIDEIDRGTLSAFLVYDNK